MPQTTLKESTGDWTDWDCAAHGLGICLGLTPPRHILWSDHPVGRLLYLMLDQLVEQRILEKRDEPDIQYRWNPTFHGMDATPPKHYGAAALGRTSRFEIEIDEALDDASDLQMSIATRGWTFRFALSARDDVARALTFLREHTGRLVFSEIALGTFHGATVWLVKDGEFGDRFWLRAARGVQFAEFVLAGDELSEFTEAVAQAVQELQGSA